MKKFFYIMVCSFLLLPFGTAACCSEEESGAKQTSNIEIRLLSIGGSYSQDALAYVPFIIQNMGIDVDIQIGILMQSSSTLKIHVDNFERDTAAYKFYLYDGGPAWKEYSHKTIQWALDNCNWDIVTLQQSSQATHSWSNYQPWCNKLINYVHGYVDYPVKFIWYQPQVRPAITNGGANWDDATIIQHYENTTEAARRILEETVCQTIVPVGTAIQNARTIPSIKALGDYAKNPLNTSGLGYLEANDGVHAQEGLPCQIEAYTFVVALLELYGLDQYSIVGETTRVTSEWARGKSIPGPHGNYIGSTDKNCRIAQECAIMAIKNPYEVTDMNYITSKE